MILSCFVYDVKELLFNLALKENTIQTNKQKKKEIMAFSQILFFFFIIFFF